MTLVQFLRHFARQHWKAYAIAGALLVAIASMLVWIPRKIGQIVDALIAKQLPPPALIQELAILLAAAVLIYFMRAWWRLALFGAAYQISVELRTRLYQKLSVHAPSFYQTRRTGDLMAGATNDIDAIEMTAGEAALAGFDGTVTLALVVCMMVFGVDWRLGLCALLPFPLMALAFWWISNHVHVAAREALDQFGHLNDHVQETLSGVRTLRALGLAAQSSTQFAVHAGRAAHASFNEKRWEAAYEPAVGTSLSMAGVIALGMGSYLVWLQELSIGQLTTFGIYLGQLIWPMFAAGWVLSLLQRGKAAWARLEPVLSEVVAVQDVGTVSTLPEPYIRFNKVTFSYPGQSSPALQSFSLQLKPGQTLGLVGPTGSGKSTALKLLLRQWTAAQGQVLWGELSVCDYTLATLRQGLAWVPQEPFLFSASVAHNIALAKPGASQKEIEQAAHMAAVHDDIMRLPLGYDTPVGERGVTLSGGQRQRVAIARALLQSAPVLVMDDALSAVDTGTESQILASVLAPNRNAAAQQTLIVVSHRLSSVVNAHSIVVLQGGRVTEQGTHAQLLELGGWYARQWRYQQLEASLQETIEPAQHG